MNRYMTVQDAAKKWCVTSHQVQFWCNEKKISGAQMYSRIWIVPDTAERPAVKRKEK